jgi:hypothetical protein
VVRGGDRLQEPASVARLELVAVEFLTPRGELEAMATNLEKSGGGDRP